MVWLPKDEIWYNVFTRERLEGTGEHMEVQVTMDTFGLFARGGSIVPICNVTE
jgi:alpha-glucosidase (family GH31 glycosyl hydrolase)